jgi:hypothetical protein
VLKKDEFVVMADEMISLKINELKKASKRRKKQPVNKRAKDRFNGGWLIFTVGWPHDELKVSIIINTRKHA